ncbi:hypothetical protein QMP26_41620 (plasmid) [Enterocloster clostridioformis]
MEKDIKINGQFSQKELLILYNACLSYGDTLTELNKKIYGCPDETAMLKRRAEESYQLAVRLTEQVGESKPHLLAKVD